MFGKYDYPAVGGKDYFPESEMAVVMAIGELRPGSGCSQRATLHRAGLAPPKSVDTGTVEASRLRPLASWTVGWGHRAGCSGMACPGGTYATATSIIGPLPTQRASAELSRFVHGARPERKRPACGLGCARRSPHGLLPRWVGCRPSRQSQAPRPALPRGGSSWLWLASCVHSATEAAQYSRTTKSWYLGIKEVNHDDGSS